MRTPVAPLGLTASIVLIVLSGAVMLGGCGNGGKDGPPIVAPPVEEQPEDEPEEGPWSYPDTLFPLEEAVRAATEAAFLERNPGLCSRLDAFGRPDSDPRCPELQEPTVADSAAAVAVAVDFLERNRDVFRLTGPLPRVAGVRGSAGIGWSVGFEPQRVNGIPVWGTSIVLAVTSRVVWAAGGHLPEPRIPAEPVLGPEEARSLLPRVITVPCWTPFEATLHPDAPLWVLPVEITGAQGKACLECRLAYHCCYASSRSLIEGVCIDAMTGAELLRVRYLYC